MKSNKSQCHILHLGWSNAGLKYKLGKEWPESSPAGRVLGVLVGNRLHRSQQRAWAAQRANLCTLVYIKPCPTSQAQKGIVLMCSALVQPHLECCQQVWAPPYKKDVKVLERVQRRATQLVEGLEGTSWEERLRALGLSSLAKRRPRGDLIALASVSRRGHGEGGAELSSLVPRDRMLRNGSKLHQGRFTLDARKHFFTERVAKHWNSVPREVVDAPSLSMF